MTRESLSIISNSPEETERFGALLSDFIPLGSVVALRGDLAAGKTCLVRGMASRYATDENVSSPTFTLVNQYGQSAHLYHMDLYRLAEPRELADLGYEDLFEPDGVCVVEWAERAEELLPECRIDIELEYVGEWGRRITIYDHGVLEDGWVFRLTLAWESADKDSEQE